MSKAAKLFLILVFVAAFIVVFAACTGDIQTSSTDALKAIAVDGGASAEIYNDQTFNPSDYTLLVTLADNSYYAVSMDKGMFVESELNSLSESGMHVLTVTYSLNGITKSILFDVKVVERVQVLPKYTVTFVMPKYEDTSVYGKQLNPVTVSSLTTPYVERKETDATYYNVEWYTTSGFGDGTLINFPLAVTSDVTVYGKLVDSRAYTIRYYQRTIGANPVDVNGERADTPFYSDATVYKNGDSHLVDFSRAAVRTGYSSPVWQVYNYDTFSYETVTAIDAEIDVIDKYVAPALRSNLRNDIVIDAVYSISYYNVTMRADLDDNGTYDVQFLLGQNADGTGTANRYYYNQTLSASALPKPVECERVGKNMAWSGYTLAGVDTVYVNENLVLTAVYTTKNYEVKFIRAGGAVASTFAVPHGQTLAAQATPQKPLPSLQSVAGYTFAWEKYTDVDGVSNETIIVGNDIGSIAVTRPINIYEKRTANQYNSTFYSGSTEITIADNEFDYASAVTFPTAAQIKAQFAVFNHDWFVFKWYTDSAATSQEIIPANETQRAADTDYYLSVVDMRRLLLTVTVAADKTQSGTVLVREYDALPFGRMLTIATADYTGSFKINYEYDKVVTVDGAVPLALTFAYNDDFIATYGSKLTLTVNDGYYDYALDADMLVKTKVFAVSFMEKLKNADATSIASYDFEYGENPENPEARGEYDVNDKTVGLIEYRFYGWYTDADDATTYVADWSAISITANGQYFAKWLPIAEGTFGVVYSNVDGRFSAVGYEGSANEVTVATTYDGTAVTGITARAFSDASDVTKIYLHDGIAYIAEGAFTNCLSLSAVLVSGGSASSPYQAADGVLYQNLGGGALSLVAYPRKKTGNYTVLSGTSKIGYEAAAGYAGTQISLGTFVTEIASRAFAFSNLTTVNLPASLTIIGAEAFRYSTSLATVATASGIAFTSIGKNAFAGTAYLANAAADSQVVLGDALLVFKGTAGATVELSAGVKLIADSAFQGQTSMTTFRVTSASPLTRIGASAFNGCMLLSDLYILTAQTVAVDVGGNAFNSTYSGLTLHVANNLAWYQGDAGWIDTAVPVDNEI